MSIIQAAGSGEVSTGFYKLLLDQSIKLNDDDSSYLKRTPASAGNRRTWTWSAWVKHGAMSHGSGQITLFDASASGSDQHGIVYSGQQFYVFGYASGFTYRKMLTALHRDPSAWYHYAVAFDTTDSTASDRIKIYVNGVRQTSFDGTNTDPSLNFDTGFNNTVAHGLGARVYDGANFFDGYIAEVNMIDGTALTADSFGETKNGIWIPKDTSGLTFGTNGFHLTFKDDVISEGFNTVTYTGTGAAQSISGIGFAPDLIWVKARDADQSHNLIDSVRGAYRLRSNTTAAEASTAVTLDNDGFSVGTETETNNNGSGLVGWCWEAGGTPTATNSAGAGATPTAGSVKIDGSNLGSALAGTIPATKISANTARGFSIVGYEATGTAGTIAHGLSAAPEFIIVKHRDQAGAGWPVYFGDNTDVMYLGENYATADDANAWNDTSPTSTVFSVGPNGGDTNNSLGGSTIAYCFHSVSGYSKFGTWQNNNSTTGTQVTGLGFKPAFIIVKNTDNTERWFIQDNTRQPTNLAPPSGTFLVPNSNAVEGQNGADTASIDFQDDGFQIKTTNPASGEISFGTRNYIYMAFADTREAAFFKDVTSNGNHFTPVNLDYRDSVPDVPTNNFCTFNPLNTFGPSAAGSASPVLKEGNLHFTKSGAVGYYNTTVGTHGVSSGKWYWEMYMASTGDAIIGVTTNPSLDYRNYAGATSTSFVYLNYDGKKNTGASPASYGATFTNGDIVGVALDMDAGTITFYKNNASQGQAFSSITGTASPIVSDAGNTLTSVIANFGQDSSFAGNKSTANSNADGNGHGSFAYAPPSGYLALCSQNLPDVDIIDGTEHFNTVLYTGTGSSNSVTGVGFQPDWVWGKRRDSAGNHWLSDVVRGATKGLHSDSTSAEYTDATVMNAFNSDGFTVVSHAISNASSATYVAWNWLAGTAFSNDASATSVGTIDSEGQINTTAGFSIISWTGIGSAGTVAHGLGATPTAIIIKNRDDPDKWIVYHQGQNASPATGYLSLNETSAFGASTSVFNNTAPTSTVFTVNTGGSVNASSEKYIAYCFTDIENYSKHGSYVGNGNADGPFIYTGFRPAWIMTKRSDGTSWWGISDDVRSTHNQVANTLAANEAYSESTLTSDLKLDFLSNGFKIRDTDGYYNASGGTYIFLAFAEQPFKFSNAR
jgi:hypothetical protein